MSWYNEVKESAEEIKPGTYSAQLAKVSNKTSGKGDSMIVLGFNAGGRYVSKFIVIRKDLSRMWIAELAKIGIKVSDALAEAERAKLSFDQFFWDLLELAKKRINATIEIGVAFTQGNDLPNITIRKLVAEPVASAAVEREPGDDGEEDPGDYSPSGGADDIPF